jgi:hypothetical protein
MAITVTISPTGLILESEALKNPNFNWNDYLESTKVILPSGDQLLTHNDLELAWTDWLSTNFEDPNLMLTLDQALNPILLNNPWSADHGITGIMELSDEDYAVLAEKINIPIQTDMISFAITA